uniref:BHLH domain-containing protein n=1 Tax=Globodera rostochiensis TaxID=31243 RepID=A0A914HHL1_GLORO
MPFLVRKFSPGSITALSVAVLPSSTKEAAAPSSSSSSTPKCLFHNDHRSVPIANLLHERFVLAATEQGKLLTLSDNFHADPAFATEEFIAQGDSLQDLIDPRDHPALAHALAEAQQQQHGQQVAFPSLVVGKHIPSRADAAAPQKATKGGVFVAMCRPLRSTVCSVQTAHSFSSTTVATAAAELDPDTFRLWLSPALHIVQQCANAKSHLKLFMPSNDDSSSTAVVPSSLYQLVHPNCASALANVHTKLLNNHAATCGGAHVQPVLLQLVTATGSQHVQPLRVHAVFVPCTMQQQLQNQGQLFEGLFQVLSDLEADAAQRADWMYSENIRSTAYRKEQRVRPHSSDHMASSLPSNGFGIVPSKQQKALAFHHHNTVQYYTIGCHQNWHQLSQQRQQQNGIKFAGDKLSTPKSEQIDLNNNVLMDANTYSAKQHFRHNAGGDVPSVGEDNEEEGSSSSSSSSIFQLPSLCDGQLPELDDRDLDEFFRQVEAKNNNDAGGDEQQQHDDCGEEMVVRKKRKKCEDDVIRLLGTS